MQPLPISRVQNGVELIQASDKGLTIDPFGSTATQAEEVCACVCVCVCARALTCVRALVRDSRSISSALQTWRLKCVY